MIGDSAWSQGNVSKSHRSLFSVHLPINPTFHKPLVYTLSVKFRWVLCSLILASEMISEWQCKVHTA